MDLTLNRFVSSGTEAERAAFTPDPPVPASGPDPGYFWYATDSGATYSWDGSAWQLVASGGTGGDVVGPASAVDDQIATFDGTTGKLIQDGGKTIAVVVSDAVTAATAAIVPVDILTDTDGFPGGTTTFLRADQTFAAPTGTGDVVGPASSVASEVVLFDGTTGKLVKRATGTGVLRATSGVYGTPGPVDLTTEVTGDLPYANLVQASAASRLLVRGSASGAGDWQEGTVGTGLAFTGTVLAATGAAAGTGTIGIVIDGGGVAITTGVKGYIQCPYAGTITGWTLLANVSGSAVVDVWKDTFANAPPVVGDSITASAKPTVTAAVTATSSTLTGWTTSITAGDVFAFNVDSASTITRLTCQLTVAK